MRTQCSNPQSAAATLSIMDNVKEYYGYTDRQTAERFGFSLTTYRDIREGLITMKTIISVRSTYRAIPTFTRRKIEAMNQ